MFDLHNVQWPIMDAKLIAYPHIGGKKYSKIMTSGRVPNTEFLRIVYLQILNKGTWESPDLSILAPTRYDSREMRGTEKDYFDKLTGLTSNISCNGQTLTQHDSFMLKDRKSSFRCT